jgi:cyclopropane fatty-acyl-phospholipid synthase-like methyltransferase
MSRRIWAAVTALTPLPLKVIAKAPFDQESRRLLKMLLRPDRTTHQTTPMTALDRYPETFTAVRDLLICVPEPRILSFGCSTGEEVLTLRRYLPGATIVGAEINKSCLEACRRLEVDGATHFVESTAQDIQQHGPYDAIFAMSVLQRLPHLVERKRIHNLSRLYPFAQFERQVVAFDQWLNKRGILVIQNTQYRFQDTTVAAGYRACGYDRTPPPTLRWFDRRGHLLKGHIYPDIIFQKQ